MVEHGRAVFVPAFVAVGKGRLGVEDLQEFVAANFDVAANGDLVLAKLGPGEPPVAEGAKPINVAAASEGGRRLAQATAGSRFFLAFAFPNGGLQVRARIVHDRARNGDAN